MVGRVLFEGQVRLKLMALSPYGSDAALAVGTLPGRPRTDGPLGDTHAIDPANEIVPVDELDGTAARDPPVRDLPSLRRPGFSSSGTDRKTASARAGSRGSPA